MSIKRFFLISLLSLTGVFYLVFMVYFHLDQQKKTDLVLDSIGQDLAEMSYIISSQMTDLQSVNQFKSLLIRKVVNTKSYAAITLVKDQKVLLTTNPNIVTPPSAHDLKTTTLPKTTSQLLKQPIYEAKVHYFVQDQPELLSLYFYSDQKFLQNYFQDIRNRFLFVFGLLPLLTLLIFWLVLRKYITFPFERLRQYAYYQSEKPTPFKIKELEYVRASMVQTFQRLEEERQDLYNLARTDNLSGLANRNLLQERLKWLIAKSKRTNAEFALVFIDLDNFKTVNDTLGHDIGDELLKSIAHILSDQLREYDIIARVGGDEFVIVMSNDLSMRDLNHVLDRLLQALSEPILVQEHPLSVSASLGVAFYPHDGVDLTGLMKSADMAMYDAKKSGKNQYKYFTQSLQDQVNYEMSMEADLRQALQTDAFELYYQPQIELRTQKVVGVEALIRWNHPTKGTISPLEFIPAAEKNGLIVKLGYWILETAIRQQTAWLKANVGSLKMSINLSAHQLNDPQFEKFFLNLMKETEAAPQNIELEMTESVLLEDSNDNLSLIKKLRATGIRIALDDFGTGYSSLSYLKRLPINTLKIDKSFMDDYDTNTGAIFIETMVNIAKTLNIKVVAEGIETLHQVNYLAAIHCQKYQGYYGSRPLNAQAFEIWLQEYNQKHFAMDSQSQTSAIQHLT
ncbi:putative bifunctional diguanylate cyclase/phosphodiesterase [Thiosulfativibrio zosterae]|uniref:cyclic-guanylate-specific phosphodiesterase n=1 Tax=Thiosulfativibrio zosterae TaxID=2675053 RepID=A0A6F8PMZ5_9GAMM|nr:EAL domain-containing protein [Thiosulfativibrio zosterae]BBP43414.1 hypothetical protein THMIRHAT_11600 [Thiosulfativibrio zosterae]